MITIQFTIVSCDYMLILQQSLFELSFCLVLEDVCSSNKVTFDTTYCCVAEIVTTHCCCDGCVASHIVAVAVCVTQYAVLSTAARYCYCRGRAGHYCLMLPPLLFLRQKKTCSLNYLILISLISCVESSRQRSISTLYLISLFDLKQSY